MAERTNVKLGAPNEERIGFSRAVRVGDNVVVGGTAPLDDAGATVGIGDPGAQTTRCFEIIADALERAGASMADVVRCRILVTSFDRIAEVIDARRAFLGDVYPVDTIVRVDGFIDPTWLVEVEVDAIVAN